MSAKVIGFFDWAMNKDGEGFRDYTIKAKVKTSRTDDGPQIVEQAEGLPLPGSHWRFGRDVNTAVRCLPDLVIRPMVTEEANDLWIVELKFSDKRTEGERLSNPLLEPPRWRGNFVRYSKQATDCIAYSVRLNPENGMEEILTRPKAAIGEEDHDENIVFIYPGPFNTAWEYFTGKNIEFDDIRAAVEVEMNIPFLPLEMYTAMVNTVNIQPMWGLPPRTIKLGNVVWSRKTYNSNVTFYYEVKYEFEINFYTWDRYIVNQGRRCLLGSSPGSSYPLDFMDPIAADILNSNRPHFENPRNYEQYKDAAGENASEPIPLDLYGRPLIPVNPPDAVTLTDQTPVYQKIVYHRAAEFLHLGVPPMLPTDFIQT